MKKLLAGAALAASILPAVAAAPLAPDAPLISDGPIVVDARDFEGNMLRIPENRRAEVRMGYDRVATIVDNIFISRSMAAKAREIGLDKDPAVQKRLQQVQDGVLADLYVQKMEKEAKVGDLEQRARELYKAEQGKYKTPEEVYTQHILVNLNGRTRETALERARKVAEEAKKGEDFLSLAARYSDDPDKRRNSGDLGYNSPNTFVEPVRKAIATMKTKGEISDPIESEYGFHIIKFVERKEPKQVPFEVVRKKIIDAETERLKKERTEALVQQVRGSPTVTIHRANVEALVVPVDTEMLKRAMEQAAAQK